MMNKCEVRNICDNVTHSRLYVFGTIMDKIFSVFRSNNHDFFLLRIVDSKIATFELHSYFVSFGNFFCFIQHILSYR